MVLLLFVKWHTVPTFDRDFELLPVSRELYQLGDAMLWITSLGAALAYNTGFSTAEHRKLLCVTAGVVHGGRHQRFC